MPTPIRGATSPPTARSRPSASSLASSTSARSPSRAPLSRAPAGLRRREQGVVSGSGTLPCSTCRYARADSNRPGRLSQPALRPENSDGFPAPAPSTRRTSPRDLLAALRSRFAKLECFVEVLEEEVDDLGVELGSPARSWSVDRLGHGERRPVEAVAEQGVEDVGDSGDPALQWDLLADQPCGYPLPS